MLAILVIKCDWSFGFDLDSTILHLKSTIQNLRMYIRFLLPCFLPLHYSLLLRKFKALLNLPTGITFVIISAGFISVAILFTLTIPLATMSLKK